MNNKRAFGVSSDYGYVSSMDREASRTLTVKFRGTASGDCDVMKRAHPAYGQPDKIVSGVRTHEGAASKQSTR